MNELLKPWAAMQKQLIAAHRSNVETMFKTMNQGPLAPVVAPAAQAASKLAEQQIQAWEQWLAMWGPKA